MVTLFLQMGLPGRSNAATYQPVSCLLLSPPCRPNTQTGVFCSLCWDHVVEWIKFEFFGCYTVEKTVFLSLGGKLGLCHPVHQKVEGSITGQGTYLGCWFNP